MPADPYEAIERQVLGEAWKEALDVSDKGAYLPTAGNALLILAHDPAIKGLVGFNEFTGVPMLLGAPPPVMDGAARLSGPFPRVWQDPDVTLFLAYLQRTWASRFSRQTVEDAMVCEAAHRPFHPVRDWLGSLRWDGKPRLDTWLGDAFGVAHDNSGYRAEVGSKFLIAAVRRVRRPGCKFDTMLVFEGEQNIGKSSAIKALFGEELFTDDTPHDLSSRDAALSLMGKWVVEFAEIEHLIKSSVETIKAFLSRSTDRYRPPYGKAFVEWPRQIVMAGTTNSADYLRDSTGNRRILPVRCQHADVGWIARNRDQLWAEAAMREAAGEAIWLEDDALAGARAEQADRMTEDVWAHLIRARLVGTTETTVPALLADPLAIPVERQGKAQEMRVAAILTVEGWERRLIRQGSLVRRVWRRKGA